MRILFLGDIVGEPGRKAVMNNLNDIKRDLNIDFCIVNGENSAGGKGITPKIAKELLASGSDVITTGDHVWDQRELIDYLPTEPRVLRPINYDPSTPGSGSIVVDTPQGKLAVLNAQGRTFMNPPLENPFTILEEEITRLRADGVKMIFLDFHAETTSESIAMGFHDICPDSGKATHVERYNRLLSPSES